MNAILLSVISFVSCTACPKDVRGFLNLPADAKCEMVKWKLDVSENGSYTVNANWGYWVDNRTFKYTGKADSKGEYKVDSRIYSFSNKYASLLMLRLNQNMFQLLDNNKNLLPGDEGYANMLTRTDPVEDKSLDFVSPKTFKKEDLVISGRTPLRPFDKELPIADSEGHQKIKWLIKFYADGRVEVREVLEHVYNWKGTWTAYENIYKLDFEGRKLTLLRGSDDIFYFVSKEGGLMNGNEEFGTALIRRRSPSDR